MEKARITKWTASSSLCVCAFLHIIQGTHETAATVASLRKSTGSDERAALDQALLLVELLKSEYARVLRENNELRGKTILRAADAQTWATTTEKPSQVSLALTDDLNSRILFEGTLPDKVAPTHPPATPFQPWNARRSLNVFRHRRRWRQPAAYYYYDVPLRRLYDNGDYSGANIGTEKWRRFNYDEVFGPQPGINKTITTKTTTASSKQQTSSQQTAVSMTSTRTTVSLAVSEPSVTTVGSGSTNVSYKTVTEPVSNAETPPSETTDNSKVSITEDTVHTKASSSSSSQYTATANKIVTAQNNPPGLERKKPLLLARKVSKSKYMASTRVRVPELSQAAVELAKELGADAAPGSFGHRFPILWRGSTKVYLADSTRYPVPLPQNHAFCFTNPHSALCRTFI